MRKDLRDSFHSLFPEHRHLPDPVTYEAACCAAWEALGRTLPPRWFGTTRCMWVVPDRSRWAMFSLAGPGQVCWTRDYPDHIDPPGRVWPPQPACDPPPPEVVASLEAVREASLA